MNPSINKYIRTIFDYFKNGDFINQFRRAPLGKDDRIIVKFDIDPNTLLRSKKIKSEPEDDSE